MGQSEVVSATLRKVSQWVINEHLATALRETADDIDAVTDWSEVWCCPVCEETTCDSDCPLSSLRGSVEP